MMKEQLIKAMQRNQFLSMMYIAKDGKMSKTRIKIIATKAITCQS
ncbi:hypothetical protein RKS58_02655 [Lysinibacillus capsici]|nr:hypothetical protein [Lysinibacillus capsici]WNN76751.1 hypothetical protein RKS58_02655 [Lysinibacillus capsici]